MKHALVLSATWLLLAASATVRAQMPDPATYYPHKKGTTWTYRAGGKTIVVKVVGVEKIGKDNCFKLETSIDGRPGTTEHIAVRKDGIYRCAVAGEVIKPPVCFLKLPAKKGATWEVDSMVGPERLKGKFESGEDELTPTYGKDKTKKTKVVTSATRDMAAGNQRLSITYSFAPGVGIVKQVANLSGNVVTLELTEFTLPKQ